MNWFALMQSSGGVLMRTLTSALPTCLAYGVIRALAEAGLRVPRDVAVVGFDDQDPSAYFQPPLTSRATPSPTVLSQTNVCLIMKGP